MPPKMMEKDWFCAGIKSKMSAGIASSSRQSERTPTLNNESVHMFMVEYCRAYQKPVEKRKSARATTRPLCEFIEIPPEARRTTASRAMLASNGAIIELFPRGNADVFGTMRKWKIDQKIGKKSEQFDKRERGVKNVARSCFRIWKSNKKWNISRQTPRRIEQHIPEWKSNSKTTIFTIFCRTQKNAY